MRRLNITLGRFGTVLLAISLALALLMLIPPAKLGEFEGEWPVMPNEVEIISLPWRPNPQIALRGELHAENATLKFYIFSISYIEAMEHFKKHNLTELKNFLNENEDKVLMETDVGLEKTAFEFVPGGITNITLAVSNEKSQKADLIYLFELLAMIAPKSRIIPVITYLSPIGAVLVGQWIFIEFKSRKKNLA